MRVLFLTFISTALLGSTCFAQESLLSNSNEPLTITADRSLEWRRNDNQFIANENALAEQGDVAIATDKLIADYRDSNGNNIEIWQTTAQGNVILSSKDTRAFGDLAVYNLDKGYAEITGDNLRIIAPDQTVTAQDRFEYWVTDGRFVAIGNAKVTRMSEQGEKSTLNADSITAILKNNDKGQRVLDRLEAKGNVTIITATETLKGQEGFYDSNSNIAKIRGNVKISRGPNTLEGERAEVDLSTNISKMFGGSTPQSRVKGVFFPGSENKKDGL